MIQSQNMSSLKKITLQLAYNHTSIKTLRKYKNIFIKKRNNHYHYNLLYNNVKICTSNKMNQLTSSFYTQYIHIMISLLNLSLCWKVLTRKYICYILTCFIHEFTLTDPSSIIALDRFLVSAILNIFNLSISASVCFYMTK